VSAPTNSAAGANPNAAIKATHSGENTTPPMLAPLYAVASAAGRVRTNHGAITALTATAPIVTQPPPLSSAAAISCHGRSHSAQPSTPSVVTTAPVHAVAPTPNRACRRGSCATTRAPNR